MAKSDRIGQSSGQLQQEHRPTTYPAIDDNCRIWFLSFLTNWYTKLVRNCIWRKAQHSTLGMLPQRRAICLYVTLILNCRLHSTFLIGTPIAWMATIFTASLCFDPPSSSVRRRTSMMTILSKLKAVVAAIFIVSSSSVVFTSSLELRPTRIYFNVAD